MIFQNFPNTTSRFAARGILNNFEISLAVLLPNTTTSHAITYTKTVGQNLQFSLSKAACRINERGKKDLHVKNLNLH